MIIVLLPVLLRQDATVCLRCAGLVLELLIWLRDMTCWMSCMQQSMQAAVMLPRKGNPFGSMLCMFDAASKQSGSAQVLAYQQ